VIDGDKILSSEEKCGGAEDAGFTQRREVSTHLFAAVFRQRCLYSLNEVDGGTMREKYGNQCPANFILDFKM
jgi:hypothetical protein